MVASKKSKRTIMQRIVARESFGKCAMANIQLHSIAMSGRKLTMLNTSVTARQVRREMMVTRSMNLGRDQ